MVPHSAPQCPTVPHCAHCFSADKQKKYGHKTRQVTPVFETILNPEPELGGESTKWRTPIYLPLGVLGVKVEGQSLTHLEEMESPESWVLSRTPPSAAHMTFAIIFSCKPQSAHLEGEIRRSLRSQRAPP